MRRQKEIVILLLLVIVTSCEVPYSNPPSDLQASDLSGVWEGNYAVGSTDRLILRMDGTFKQIYRDDTENYMFETPWNAWWIERRSGGQMRVHLRGARYYLAGIGIAEESERKGRLFWDPIAQESVLMQQELVLNLQINSASELVLVHMWLSNDRGFALVGREVEEMHRVAKP